MKEVGKKQKLKSDTRKRSSAKWTVRADESEANLIRLNAANTGLHPSSLMRALALGYSPKSIVDSKHMIELVRLRGDLGRVGGLLKIAVNNKSTNDVKPSVLLIRDIDKLKDQIREVIESLEKKR